MQTVSSGFTAAAAAAGRHVVDYLEISWDGAGTIDAARGATHWTDETAYLISHEGQLRLSAPGDDLVAPGDIGQATITLRNVAGRYSWRRSDSPLAAYIGGATGLSGFLVRIWAGFYVAGSPEYVCIFTGLIGDWHEDSAQGRVELSCRDMGAVAIQDKRSTVLALNQRPDVWIGALADLAGVPAGAGGRLLDPGIFAIPWCWLDDESLVAEIWDTAAADGGMAWFDQRGRLRFENAVHWLAHAVAWTFAERDYKLPDPQNSMDDVATLIVSEWSGRGKGIPTVVYTLDTLKVIGPGQSVDWEARFSYPVTELLPFVASGKERDYAASSEGGADVAGSLTITLSEVYAQHCKVTVANTHATLAARLVFFQMRGRPLIGGPTEQVKQAASPAPYPFERQRSIRGNLYVQTEQQARAFIGYQAAKHARVRPTNTLRGAPAIPQLELGDRVAYADTRGLGAGQTLEGYVTGINWYPTDAGCRQDISVLDATGLFEHEDYFIVGVSTLGFTTGGNSGRCWY